MFDGFLQELEVDLLFNSWKILIPPKDNEENIVRNLVC